MAYNAGDVESQLTLERSPFITGLKMSRQEAEKFRKEASKILNVPADIDQKPFNRALTAMQAKLTKFTAKTYTAKLRIDDVGQLPKITAINKRLAAFDKRVFESVARVKVDDKDFRKLLADLNNFTKRKYTGNVGVNVNASDIGAAETLLGNTARKRNSKVKPDVDQPAAKAVSNELALIARDRTINMALNVPEIIYEATIIDKKLKAIEGNRYVNFIVEGEVVEPLAQLEILSNKADKLDGRRITMRAHLDGFMNVIKNFKLMEDAADSSGASMSRYTKRLIWMGTAITVAAAPALGVLSTLLATLPVVAAGAGLALTTLSLGFDNFATAVSNPVTATEIKRKKKALEELSPVAREVADYFNGPFKAAFKGVQTAIQDELFKGFMDDLRMLTGLLPTVRQGLVDNASALNRIMRGMLGVITSSQGLRTIADIIRNMNKAMSDLAPMFTTGTQTFMTMALIGSQTFGYLVTELNKFAAGFDSMIQNAVKTGILAEAFRQLANVTGSLLYAFTQLMGAGFQAMVETGPGLSTFIRNFTDTIVALMPILSNISNIFFNIFNPALAALTPLLYQIAPAFDALQGTSSALGPFISALGQAIGALLTVIVPVVTWVLNFATSLLQLLGPLAGPIMGAIVGIIAGLRILAMVINIARIATTIFSLTLLANPITWVVIGIVALIAIIVLLVKNWDTVTAAMGAAWEWLKGVFAAGWEAIKSAVGALIDWFADLPNKIAYFVGFILGSIIKFGIDLYNGFMNAMVQLTTFFVTLPTRIKTWLGDATVWLMTTGKDAITGFLQSMVNAAIDIWVWLRALPANFTTYLTNAASWLVTTGYDLIMGLKQGLINAWVGFMTWIGTLFSSFIDGIKAGLGIASPSTIMAEIGLFLIQGLLNGISAAWAMITGFFSRVWDGIKLQVTAGFSAISTAFNAGLAFISNLWNTVWNSVSTFFSNVWNGIKVQATIFWSAIQAFFSAALSVFSRFWSGVWQGIIDFFVSIWNGIKIQATILWNAIKDFFFTALNAYVVFWSGIWQGIINFFTNIWNQIYARAMYAWALLKMYWDVAIAAFKFFWESTWNAILNFFTTLWNNLKQTAINLWNMLRSFWDNALNSFSSFWSGMWDGIKATFDRVFSGVIDIAKRIWQTVKDVFRGGINAVVKGVNWPIDKINGLFGISIPTIPEIPPFAVGGYLDMPSIPNAKAGPVRGPGGPRDDRVVVRQSNKEHVWSAKEVQGAGGHAAVERLRAQALHGQSSELANKAMRTPSTLPGLDRIKLMNRFPSFDDVGIQKLAYGGVQPQTAAAGDEITRIFGPMPGGIGGIGQRSGPSDHPKGLALDYMTLGNTGLGDRVAAHLERNAARMQVKYLIWKQRINEGNRGWQGMENRGSVTANHFDHVHASFLGEGGSGGGGLFSVDYGAIFDMLAGPFKPIGEAFLRQVVPNPPLPNWVEDTGVGLYNKGWDGLRKKAIELMQAIGFGGGGGGGGDVERWRPLVLSALARVGQPAHYADRVLMQINSESGGNPNAVNNWDINAMRGTPSGGLLQVIEPTFQRHRDPALPNNKFDPFANIVASMRYALWRYGSLDKAYRGVGYDSGGTLSPGWTMAFNGTGGDEDIITAPQRSTIMETINQARSQVTNNTRNTGITAEEIERIINKLMQTRPLIGTLAPQMPEKASVKDLVDEVMFELRHTTKGMYE